MRPRRPNPETAAAELDTAERILLFCLASGTSLHDAVVNC